MEGTCKDADTEDQVLVFLQTLKAQGAVPTVNTVDIRLQCWLRWPWLASCRALFRIAQFCWSAAKHPRVCALLL